MKKISLRKKKLYKFNMELAPFCGWGYSIYLKALEKYGNPEFTAIKLKSGYVQQTTQHFKSKLW